MKTFIKILIYSVIITITVAIVWAIDNAKQSIKLTYIEDTTYLDSNILNDKQDNQAVVIDGVVYELFYNKDIGHYIYRFEQIETIKLN